MHSNNVRHGKFSPFLCLNDASGACAAVCKAEGRQGGWGLDLKFGKFSQRISGQRRRKRKREWETRMLPQETFSITVSLYRRRRLTVNGISSYCV